MKPYPSHSLSYRRIVSVSLVALWVLPFCLLAGELPEWRNAHQPSGIWKDPSLPPRLPRDGPKTLWQKKIGNGFAAPTVYQKRLFIMDRLPATAEREEKERVLCLDPSNGKEIWTKEYPCKLKIREYANGPRSSPVVDVSAGKTRLYTLGAMGNFHCLDATNGKVLWSKDLVQEYQAVVPRWGVANFPWIEDDLVIIQAGGTNQNATVVAFDKFSGKEVWRNLSDKAGYASIISIEAGGQKQLIVWTGDALCSLDPKSGKLFWRMPRKLAWDQAIATPIFHAPSQLLLISSDREGTVALKMDPKNPGYTVAWENMNYNALHSRPVLLGDYLYGITHNGAFVNECGQFRCVNILDGKLQWAATNVTRIGMFAQGHASYNTGNQTWYLLNEQGELILASADAKQYQEKSRWPLIGKTWSLPLFAEGKIFARSEETLLCADLARGNVSQNEKTNAATP